MGIFHLFLPEWFLQNTGHSIPQADIYYPLAMLASRFIAYGIAFIYIAKEPLKYIAWIQFMVLIQLIDLGAGIFYTLTGVINIADSAFPMFNAIWISALLLLWMPKKNTAA
ncbi:MAG: hypothetical protein Q9O24_00925 [Gammaproteobacteria bacterium]|nr:hypothetical protein [Gammaproteobacteria bacterium]